MSVKIFPIDLDRSNWNGSMTEKWTVDEQVMASGRRRTLCQQALPSWEFSVTFPNLTSKEKDTLLGFYAQMKGSWGSFFVHDGERNTVTGQALPSVSSTTFQCIAPLGNYAEAVEYADVKAVYIGGEKTTAYTASAGKIILASTIESGTAVTADYDYYWHVAFSGSLSIQEVFNNLYKVTVKFKVVRE